MKKKKIQIRIWMSFTLLHLRCARIRFILHSVKRNRIEASHMCVMHVAQQCSHYTLFWCRILCLCRCFWCRCIWFVLMNEFKWLSHILYDDAAASSFLLCSFFVACFSVFFFRFFFFKLKFVFFPMFLFGVYSSCSEFVGFFGPSSVFLCTVCLWYHWLGVHK